jgi:hypothetical protein
MYEGEINPTRKWQVVVDEIAHRSSTTMAFFWEHLSHQ